MNVVAVLLPFCLMGWSEPIPPSSTPTLHHLTFLPFGPLLPPLPDFQQEKGKDKPFARWTKHAQSFDQKFARRLQEIEAPDRAMESQRKELDIQIKQLEAKLQQCVKVQKELEAALQEMERLAPNNERTPPPDPNRP